jgi:hypothetical protein
MENNFTSIPVIITTTNEAIFDIGQKIFFIFFASSFFTVFAFLILKIAKKKLTENESYLKRMYFLYILTSSCMIGLFVCVTLPHSMLRAALGTNQAYTVHAVSAFGILIGFNIMLSIQRCFRITNGNSNYHQPTNVSEREDPLLNKENMEMNDHIVLYGNDASLSKDTYPSYINAMDKSNDVSIRRIYGFILYIIIVYLTVMDGFFIVYWSDKSLDSQSHWIMIVMSAVVRVCYSIVICGGLIHGHFHTIKLDRWFKYFYAYKSLCLFYLVVLILSSLPLLLNLSVDDASYILQQIPFTIFYGIISGIFLWLLTYFIWIQDPSPTKKSVRNYLISIWLITIILGVTGLFI